MNNSYFLLVLGVFGVASQSIPSLRSSLPYPWYAFSSSDILKLDSDPSIDIFSYFFSQDAPADITVEHFFAQFWQQKHLHVSRNDGSRDHFTHLFPMMVLDPILDTSLSCKDTDARRIRYGAGEDVFMLKKVFAASDQDYWSGILPLGDEIEFSSLFARNAFSRGFSLVLNKLNCRWKPIEKVTEQSMKQCFGYRTNVNLYFTPKNSSAFEVHFDWMESIVLQIYGSKNWILYPDEPASLKIPFPSMKFKPRASNMEKQLSKSIFLEAGDALYIPSGLMHEASAIGLDENSMHLTIGIEIDPLYTWMGLVLVGIKHIEKKYAPEWAQSHEFANFLVLDAALEPGNWFLRKAVPFGIWMNSPMYGKQEFHSILFGEVVTKLMESISYKRAKRRLTKFEAVDEVLKHFHESIRVYFANLIVSLQKGESVRLGKKDLLDVAQYMQDFELFDAVMQEFILTVKTAKKQCIYNDRANSEKNYRKLTEWFVSSAGKKNPKDGENAEKDEL